MDDREKICGFKFLTVTYGHRAQCNAAEDTFELRLRSSDAGPQSGVDIDAHNAAQLAAELEAAASLIRLRILTSVSAENS